MINLDKIKELSETKLLIEGYEQSLEYSRFKLSWGSGCRSEIKKIKSVIKKLNKKKIKLLSSLTDDEKLIYELGDYNDV